MVYSKGRRMAESKDSLRAARDIKSPAHSMKGDFLPLSVHFAKVSMVPPFGR